MYINYVVCSLIMTTDCTWLCCVLDDLFHIQWPLWLQGELTKVCVYVCMYVGTIISFQLAIIKLPVILYTFTLLKTTLLNSVLSKLTAVNHNVKYDIIFNFLLKTCTRHHLACVWSKVFITNHNNTRLYNAYVDLLWTI